MVIESALVTGGCGFVGARIVEHLRQKYPQCRITVLDTNLGNYGEVNKDVEYLQGDVTSPDVIASVFDGREAPFQVVIHVANLSPPLSERYARRLDALVFRINVDGTRNVLEAAHRIGVSAFVYTSSICAVTDDFSQSYANIDERWPLVLRGKGSSYGESKAVAETMVLQANSVAFKTCALRPCVIFGEGDYQLVPSIVNCITKNESPFRIGDGMNLWDTVYVGNVADAHVLTAENLLSQSASAAGEAFFIQNNEPVSCRDFMLQVWKEYNGHIPPFEIGIPIRLAWLLGIFSEMYSWLTKSPATLSRGSVVDATAMRYANGEKARRILGYEPKVSLEEGLRKSCQVSESNDNNQ